MGMYSTFIKQDIKILNKDELLKIRSERPEELNNLIDEDGDVSFSSWDGHKLESYWYNETLRVLEIIAPHIEGYAEFSYEEGYGFRLVFEEGKVFHQTQPEPNWEEIEKFDLLKNFEDKLKD